MEIDSQILLKIAPYLSIISHTPGRIRVRVSSDIRKLDLDFGLVNEKVLQIKAINDVKFNPLVGSITITYDSSILEPKFWENLINAEDLDGVTQTISRLI